ncbi:hypothetical protein HPC49_04535 [Pyxidicoccus fallax]|uniref:Uncharacterized protein n=1 Tax=Pyxidicoccus fallax TaxID=394095 RepID=A0A848LF69_9BACT|nr:hypothetical protein [Pyxidicoccus fallax]NMO14941.1 hypothetical protein [Pyxidicoccus fallax]NPC77517.1 hypothetical protein [Pyxidicoccus fallax]
MEDAARSAEPIPTGILWAKIQDLRCTLSFLESRSAASEDVLSAIRQYREFLVEASNCIQKRRRRLFPALDNPRFWGLVHRVHEGLLLIMPIDMLASEALSVESHFRRNIREPIAAATWLGHDGKSGPLCQAIRVICKAAEEGSKSFGEARLDHARQVLRSALSVVNKHSDRYFRQLTLTMWIRSMSGVLLVLLFILAAMFELPREFYRFIDGDTGGSPEGITMLRDLSFILLGAGGAIAANMLSEEPVATTKGPIWRQFVYYLFIKPSMGAIAAFVFYLLAVSQLFFSIESRPAALQQEQLRSDPPVQIVLGSDKALVCTYALLFIAVGFSAERRLGPVMDKVLNRLVVMAEKHEGPDVMATSVPPPTSSPSGRS